MPAATLSTDSLITLTQPDAPAAEEFRRLRTNVQFADIDRPLRTLALVAAQAGTGKSVIAANLAIAFAQAGKQVILVDADLGHATQHQLFDVTSAPGLTEVLAGEAALDQALAATAAPGVRLLPAGSSPANPAQMLNAARMDTLVARLLEFADLVIFDTSALADLTDSALFAAKLDGVLLVADSGASRRDDMVNARDLLVRVHAHILGVVLNQIEPPGGRLGRLVGRG